MFEYVVCHGKDRVVYRLVKVNRKTEILTEAKKAFKLDGEYHLELLHERFGVYITLDCCDDIPDEGQLKLVAVSASHEPLSRGMQETLSTADTLSIHSSASIPHPATDHRNLSGQSVLSAPSTSAEQTESQSELEDHVDYPVVKADQPRRAGPSVLSAPSTSVEQTESQSELEDHVDDPVVKANQPRRQMAVDPGLISRATRDRLESNTKLTWADWSDIMQATFDTYIAEHKTPYVEDGKDKAPYRQIASDLLHQYPCVLNSLEVEQEKAMDYLAKKIRFKFKNSRKRCCSPTEKERRTCKKKDSRVYVDGLPNYYPDPPKNMSLLDIERCLNDLKHGRSVGEERQKQLRDTLHVRRRDIVGRKTKNKKGMIRLKMVYQFLFSADGLWTDMALLAGKPVEEKYRAAFEALMEQVASKTFCSKEEAAESFLRMLDQDGVLHESGSNSQEPSIQMDPEVGECAVCIEGHEVARTATLAEAILLLSMSIFVFHQKTARVKNLMWVMCRYVFDIPPETKPGAEAKTAMRELVGDANARD